VRDGKLFALVGGKPEDVERALSVLELLTRRIMHIGPAGSGYAMKLAVNLGLGAYIQAISESLALGMQQGLGLDVMLEVLQEAPYASGWMKSKIGVIKGEPPEIALDIHLAQGHHVSGCDRRVDRRAGAAVGRHAGRAIGRRSPGK
jgi:3-hydroxyisobutyrate dehydrogenase-like beta-hydroxyacid dehydrogenase